MAEVEYSIAPDLMEAGPIPVGDDEPERAPEVTEAIMEVKEEFEETKRSNLNPSLVSSRIAMGRKDF